MREAGLIPAHAGKTLPAGMQRTVPAAHPRSRGENGWFLAALWLGSGSSPLTRGKRLLKQTHGRGPGLIPAHAGKTELTL